jgi:hypothetical protein
MMTVELEMLALAPPIWGDRDRRVIQKLDQALERRGSEGARQLRGLLRAKANMVSQLGKLMVAYPSLFAHQTLGTGMRAEQRRNAQTLVAQLAAATAFTLEMYLPMRAIAGKSYIMARLNFFRMMRRAADAELLARDEDVSTLYEEIDLQISRCVYARVVEELLISVVCQNELDLTVRERAALGLAHLWEDRLHFPMREFFPILEHTWEARRRLRVTYGTLGGASELLSLISEGCDPDFIQYFSSVECSDDETMAFREFLFGLSTEELAEAERRRIELGSGVVSWAELRGGTLSAPAAEEALDRPRDPATRLFSFFMKRHLEATARAIGHLPGPKRTAEEYVLIAFLMDNEPSIFGED